MVKWGDPGKEIKDVYNFCHIKASLALATQRVLSRHYGLYDSCSHDLDQGVVCIVETLGSSFDCNQLLCNFEWPRFVHPLKW